MRWPVFFGRDSSPEDGVRLLYYFIVFNFFTTFSEWFIKGYLSVANVRDFSAVCPPYFQQCLNFHVFNTVPEGYSLGILYAVLGSFIVSSLYYSLQNKWNLAFYLLLPPLLFKIVMIYLLSYNVTGNYTVLEIMATLILLFSKNIIFSLKVLVSSLYLFSAVIKVYPTYLSGGMFNTLQLGLPLLPSSLNHIYPWLIVIFFVISSILIWSKNRVTRITIFLFLFVFHLYTIILVGFRFPSICILILLCIATSEFQTFSFAKFYKDKIILFITLFLILVQLPAFIIQGDEHITGEGERYGFYIFNTNKQCILEKTYIGSQDQETPIVKGVC